MTRLENFSATSCFALENPVPVSSPGRWGNQYLAVSLGVACGQKLNFQEKWLIILWSYEQKATLCWMAYNLNIGHAQGWADSSDIIWKCNEALIHTNLFGSVDI